MIIQDLDDIDGSFIYVVSLQYMSISILFRSFEF